MTTSHDGRNVEFGGPANYRIVVQGLLGDNCRRRFAGMRIEVSRVDGEAPRTVLVGPVRDQAELRGVLDALYGLHMPVIAVERCEAG